MEEEVLLAEKISNGIILGLTVMVTLYFVYLYKMKNESGLSKRTLKIMIFLGILAIIGKIMSLIF